MTRARPARARAFYLGLLAAIAIAGSVSGACYRPRRADCTLSCSAEGLCPDGLACSAGLCTSGPVCVTGLSAGSRHSCAIRAGAITCWGDNTYGQLGTGDHVSRGVGEAPAVAVDLSGVGGLGAIGVAAGGRHTCALLGDRPTEGITGDGGLTIACWGDDSFGQVGSSALAVVPVAKSSAKAISALAAGYTFTCALQGGSVVCWGDNRMGQLGVAAAGPNRAMEPVLLDGRAVAIAAGAYHACAVLEDHTVRCWGWNDYGQLGDVDRTGGDRAPGVVVAVKLPPAKAVAAGAYHTCALLVDEGVSCWGLGDAGQLGVKPIKTPPAVAPGTPVDLGPGRNVHAIGAGSAHSCAVLDDFSVRCWGLNRDGQLGIGDVQNRGDDGALGALPKVRLGAALVSQLAVGANHGCVIQAAGIKCWGANDAGQLGVGDRKNRGDVATPTIEAAHP